MGVLQVGQTVGGYPFLVMQYHRAGSLQARIARLGRLPLGEVLRVGVKMAGALQSAHNVDIVHRDVKPANILLTEFGQPALGDFGIAHIADGFQTATGTFTVVAVVYRAGDLEWEAPSPGLLMCMGWVRRCLLDRPGHAAYERNPW